MLRFVSNKIANFRERVVMFSDNVIFWSTILSFVLFIILTLLIVFKLKPGPEPMAVHYNVLIGVDLVKSGWFLYQLPLFGLVIFVYNLYLARKFFRFEPFAAHLLVISTGAVLLGLILSVVSLIQLLA